MAKSTVLFSFCSLLMAAIFAYSASVQLNDPDWYLWFPLYACAWVVNMVNWEISSKAIIRQIAKELAMLVSFSFGLPLIFFVVRNGEMKFDNISENST